MSTTIDLWDWRRRIADLYAAIRANANADDAWHHWSETRAELFRTHPQSPIEEARRTDYAGPRVFGYDPAFRFEVDLATADGAAEVLSAGEDGGVTIEPFARTVGLGAALGGELTLYWIGGYGGGVFLPFADSTSGHETYGAGRYLLDTIKSADLGRTPSGKLILDFTSPMLRPARIRPVTSARSPPAKIGCPPLSARGRSAIDRCRPHSGQRRS